MLMKRLKQLWCEAVHDSVMWPIDGHYVCRVCGCRYEVSWTSGSDRGRRTDLGIFTSEAQLAPVTRR